MDVPPEVALDAAGCCFLFAPLYHPAFKSVAPVRKALAEEGSATVFNLLGPLLNPARPDFQLAGVFDRRLLPVYAETFRLLGRKRGWAVHGYGGLDEVSTLGPSEVHAVEDGAMQRFSIQPDVLGMGLAAIEDLRGGDARKNAELLEEILLGRERGPKRDIVVLNAACAVVVRDFPAIFLEAWRWRDPPSTTGPLTLCCNAFVRSVRLGRGDSGGASTGNVLQQFGVGGVLPNEKQQSFDGFNGFMTREAPPDDADLV
jgi:anthranilate phosphoribosyltransferase